MPIDLLSLPLEVRQSILIQTYSPEPQSEEPRRGLKVLKRAEQEDFGGRLLIRFMRRICNGEMKYLDNLYEAQILQMTSWVAKLGGVHESLGEELVYVQMQWRETLEFQAAERIRSYKEIEQKLCSKEKRLGIRAG